VIVELFGVYMQGGWGGRVTTVPDNKPAVVSVGGVSAVRGGVAFAVERAVGTSDRCIHKHDC
jgi:hypothetical protein